MVLKTSGQAIGQVHIDPYVNMWYRVAGDPETPVRNIEVELAFAFGKAYWGQSYAFEACRVLVDYAFRELKIPRLVGGAMRRTAGPSVCKSVLGLTSMRTRIPVRPAGRPGYRC